MSQAEHWLDHELLSDCCQAAPIEGATSGDGSSGTCSKCGEHATFKETPCRPYIICLCGSTRFREAFEDAARQGVLDGHIILSVGTFRDEAGEHPLTQDEKDLADELHLRKIDLADAVHVLNVGGYIGASTTREIAYATKTKKRVTYLEAEDQVGLIPLGADKEGE